MLISEARLRVLIREALLAEAVEDKHGYSVQSVRDIMWSADKAQIPKDRNPFVGGSRAFDSWFNDGEMVKKFFITLNRGTDDERRKMRFQDVFINEGDLVIIPELWPMMPAVGEVIAKNNISAIEAGVPRASEIDTISLTTVQFPFNKEIPTKDGVGVAFLRRIGSSRSHDAFTAREAAREYMMSRGVSTPDEPVSGPAGDRRTIRRRAGETMSAPAPSPARPRPMTPEEREMLLGRRRE